LFMSFNHLYINSLANKALTGGKVKIIFAGGSGAWG